MKKIVIACVFSILFIDAFPQSWESVRNSDDYIYGVGTGSTVSEADKNALADLISKIATNVSGETNISSESVSQNGIVDETSQFSQSIKTYSQATLTNTGQIILQEAPSARVARWIKKAELERIFEARKRKAIDLVESALKAEEKGQADLVLRDYYWALTLLKSLQYPNEVMFRDKTGKLRILTHLIKEEMDETFAQLKVQVVSRDGDDVKLRITYKDKPVSSVSYTYFDGNSWSNIYDAKDGCGVLEMEPGFAGAQIQLKYEYVFAGQAKIDSEIESVLGALKDTPMPKASTHVAMEVVKEKSKKEKKTDLFQNSSFSSTDPLVIAPPKAIGKKDASSYMSITEKVLKAVRENNYQSVRDFFTPDGWDIFTKLLRYGKAKVLDATDIRVVQDNENVAVRGLRMSFSFASNVRKTFVENVNFIYNGNKQICNIAFGLGRTAEDDIMNKGVWEEKSRMAIMQFLENYKTAYALKRLDYIRSVFDDDAIIITGTVIKRATPEFVLENKSHISTVGNQIIKRNRQTKDQYIKNLARCFERNEFVNIQFANNDVQKMGKGGEVYAIQISQDYYSSTYGDKGYLMLMVDINNPDKPIITLRTWQPDKDPDFGLYEPGDF